ncbi:Redoxin [Aquiflexum balticum DSM 16537]|uniref:Redoxin n=1 Tax=Aquiflexum balticum DSM 16537 TaxID=758820 RepID=A0A1W2H3F6_9BACT|nr:TlpA disulfide reductase family protein [Aquiflexum balticum]SMD43453.1 Redoxin [Aquiflexum balticum DSM 16537]
MKSLNCFLLIPLLFWQVQFSSFSHQENELFPDSEVENFRDYLNVLIDSDDISPLLEDEILVINLWATWCGPCIQEIPELNELVDKYHDQNVRFLAFSDESKADFEKFRTRRPSFEFNFEKSFENFEALEALMKLDQEYQGRAIPLHILVMKDGSVKEVFVGGSKYNIQRIESFIKKEIKRKS